jgi:hypothetical protein
VLGQAGFFSRESRLQILVESRRVRVFNKGEPG